MGAGHHRAVTDRLDIARLRADTGPPGSRSVDGADTVAVLIQRSVSAAGTVGRASGGRRGLPAIGGRGHRKPAVRSWNPPCADGDINPAHVFTAACGLDFLPVGTRAGLLDDVDLVAPTRTRVDGIDARPEERDVHRFLTGPSRSRCRAVGTVDSLVSSLLVVSHGARAPPLLTAPAPLRGV